jgi:hypothetical protein
MFVLCSQALLERFIELHSGAARHGEGSSPVGGTQHPAL